MLMQLDKNIKQKEDNLKNTFMRLMNKENNNLLSRKSKKELGYYSKKWRSLTASQKSDIQAKVTKATKSINFKTKHLKFLEIVGSTGLYQMADILAQDETLLSTGYAIKNELIKVGIILEPNVMIGLFKPIMLSDIGNWLYFFQYKKNPCESLLIREPKLLQYLGKDNIDKSIERIIDNIILTNNDISIIFEHDSDKEIFFIFKKAIRIAFLLDGLIYLNDNEEFIFPVLFDFEEKQKIQNITTRKILLIIQAMKNADGKGDLKATCPKKIYEELEDKHFKNQISDNVYDYIKIQLTSKTTGTKLSNLFEYITLLL